MNITARRIFFLSFVCLFFIVTSLVLLYGSGFIIDWTDKTIKKTGILMVRGEPEDTTLTLNGAVVATVLPHREIHLPPATYTVVLSKEGYYPWTRDLVMEGGVTSFIGDVVLWKKSQPVHHIPLAKKIDLLQINGAQFLTLSVSSTQGFDISLVLPNGSERLLSSLASYPTVLLSPEQEKIIAFTRTPQGIIQRAPVITLSGEEESFDLIKATASTSTVHLTWHTTNNWLIYGNDQSGALWQFNTINKTKKYIGNGILLTVYDDGVFFITNNSLVRWDATTENTRSVSLTPQISLQDSEIQKTFEQFVIITTREKNTFIIDLEKEIITPSPVHSPTIFKVSAAINTTLIANDHELWMRDIHKTNTLLWRTSEVLKDISFIADTRYIIVTTNEKARILTLDPRDGQKNTIELPLPSFTSLFVDTEGTTLFMGSASSAAYGVFSLELRDVQ